MCNLPFRSCKRPSKKEIDYLDPQEPESNTLHSQLSENLKLEKEKNARLIEENRFLNEKMEILNDQLKRKTAEVDAKGNLELEISDFKIAERSRLEILREHAYQINNYSKEAQNTYRSICIQMSGKYYKLIPDYTEDTKEYFNERIIGDIEKKIIIPALIEIAGGEKYVILKGEVTIK